jgi:hypothetical protein
MTRIDWMFHGKASAANTGLLKRVASRLATAAALARAG